jgi:hypothetical protein
MVSIAADLTILEMSSSAPKFLRNVSKITNGGGGILGFVDNGIQTVNDYQKGNTYRMSLNGAQTLAYGAGAALVLSGFGAPLGGALILGATISDFIQMGVEEGTGINDY